MDKPFKCHTCGQCFANSDHLGVHLSHHAKQKSLQVKIPGILNGPLTDQTPTPTRFLKTAEVDGSVLFEEINPFDQDFKMASKRQNSVIAEQSPAVGSTTGDESPSDISKLEQLSEVIHSVSTKASINANEASKSTANQNPVLQAVLKQLQQNKPLVNTSTLSTALPSVLTSSNTASSVLTSSGSSSIVFTSAHTATASDPTSVTSSTQQQKSNSSQDLLREQLKALIKSGQIKIQFSSDPSSPKVQATIVGNVPAKSSAVQTSLNSQAKQLVVAPKQVSHQTSVTPMSVLSVPAATIVSSANMVHMNHSDVNLAIAKQKLKQVIQANSSDNNNLLNGRVSMVKNMSSQGKYKDIILVDEKSNDSSGSENYEMPGKRKRSSEDATPEEKRRRFLERNRAAASRCRQKRKVWVNQLEQKSDDLIQTNSQLMSEITALRSEVAQLKGLLLAHKDCPVTLQQKALISQLTTSGAYVVSDGQIIAIHQVPNGNVQASSAEELATSALTDMASRATVELGHRMSSGTVTVQANDSSVSTISSNLMQR
ncbi:cyclic AMP-dependent transcription factor ATF-2-like [Hydractinia symbiolongicarpus]|uniref:cyclic AMP-dependent transcription factor ATF-2-like n=1 Tax=Hydractinia symbiolongicarpus TaxID=13093 RepID=UPI00254D698A|nr:cyclic AMP-dependent transcription factor ATF-2-like [Hydractinia symbiolongicarpus]XP_057293853.1 cyclic AMP-dependent transcription factor ATF-2-like [Hydractinia symbiolongicarpus]XP_057293854.1 cyclic AMP-dependent transcription factor ATF-2-like [Hydractinia symbiolongicarpus]